MKQIQKSCSSERLCAAVGEHELGLAVLQSKDTTFVVSMQGYDVHAKVADMGDEIFSKDSSNCSLVVFESHDWGLLRVSNAHQEVVVLDSCLNASGVESTDFAASGMKSRLQVVSLTTRHKRHH